MEYTKNGRACNNCGTVEEFDSEAIGGLHFKYWYILFKKNKRYDFCCTVCLQQWSNHLSE